MPSLKIIGIGNHSNVAPTGSSVAIGPLVTSCTGASEAPPEQKLRFAFVDAGKKKEEKKVL